MKRPNSIINNKPKTLIKKPKLPEPNIFPKSRIGRNKFNSILKDPTIKEKEIQLLSVPGKGTYDVSYKRHIDHVGRDTIKFEKILNEKVKESLKKKIRSLENKSQLLHTHIIKRRPKNTKTEFGMALPSRSDIVSFMQDRQKSIKYQIISVIDPKRRKPIGYTTIKINTLKATSKQFIERIDGFLTKRNVESAEYKKYIFEMMESLGMEIYFTPEDGYALNKDFNYVRKNEAKK
ncbi:MAG: hypothetical protein PHX47_01955 [Candidatus ainarchaeum sp.]|nr:hypothetical protein [Candidatus ainarchaeum sp.]